jgi:hypothetical protein
MVAARHSTSYPGAACTFQFNIRYPQNCIVFSSSANTSFLLADGASVTGTPRYTSTPPHNVNTFALPVLYTTAYCHGNLTRRSRVLMDQPYHSSLQRRSVAHGHTRKHVYARTHTALCVCALTRVLLLLGSA